MTSAVSIFARLRAPSIAALTAIFFLAPASARAEIDKPFDLEPSSWISFDRYKEKPKNWIPPEVRAQVAAEPVVVPAPTLPPDMPMITEPKRPLTAPGMPGMNRDMTADAVAGGDDRDSPLVLNDGKTAELPVPSGSWKDAHQFARNKKLPGMEDEDGPLDVRFTALPSRLSLPTLKPKKPVPPPQIAETKSPEPQPSATASSTPSSAPSQQAQAQKSDATKAAAATPPPAAADPAQCAAIDAYKQRQLAAIESDRRTLEALQKAIDTLGLNKQLDFITRTGDSTNVQQVDVAPVQVPAKN